MLENDKSRQQCLTSGRSLTVVEPRMCRGPRGLGGQGKLIGRESKRWNRTGEGTTIKRLEHGQQRSAPVRQDPSRAALIGLQLDETN